MSRGPGIGQKSPRTEALELRRTLGWTPSRIAAALGVTVDQVNVWLYPPRIPRISAASQTQRQKVKGTLSIVSGEQPCDPAHLWPRALGGCDDPLCVVALTRPEHREFDEGRLDLMPSLIARGCIPELQHALAHAQGDLIGLLERLTGERWQPVEKAA